MPTAYRQLLRKETMALRRRIVLLLCLALAGPVLAEEPRSVPDAPRSERLQAWVEALAAEADPRVAGVGLASVPVLAEVYRGRDFRRLWRDQGQATDLLRAIARSPDEGLSPSDFHDRALTRLLGGNDLGRLTAQTRDEADLLLTDSLLRYLHHRLFGKIDPVAIDRKLHYADPPTLEDMVMQLGAALDAADLGVHLTQLVREPTFYVRLREGLARYRAAAASGGWGTIPAGAKLVPGARDQRVAALRERLRASGEYQGPSPADPKVYDKGLQEAVKAFQGSHGLPADAVVGSRTQAELNVPVTERIGQIRVNLERMRWVYRDLPEDYLLVDVVGFQVHLMRGSEVEWSTRAQVGRADRQTPSFRDQVEYLELNPTWTVPPTILKDDILPKARLNPGYVAKKGLKAIDRNGRSVPLSAVNWNLPARSFPYTLRQDGGGDKAALGKIKFMFPNRFSVYLHDTPSRRFFNQPVRMTSSGCVRVDKPFELAERVLGEPQRWSVESLQGLVSSGKTRTVRLKEPLAIILSYWTAEGLGGGQVQFRGDIYGRDAALLAALGEPVGVRVKLPPPPEPASEPPPVSAPPGVAEPPAPDAPAAPVEAARAPSIQVGEPQVAAGATPLGLPPVEKL